MIVVKSPVRYTGNNRPLLKTMNGLVKSFNSPKTSAYVEFFRANGEYFTSEWVGMGALEEITSTTSALVALEQKRDELKAELDKYNQAIELIKGVS